MVLYLWHLLSTALATRVNLMAHKKKSFVKPMYLWSSHYISWWSALTSASLERSKQFLFPKITFICFIQTLHKTKLVVWNCFWHPEALSYTTLDQFSCSCVLLTMKLAVSFSLQFLTKKSHIPSSSSIIWLIPILTTLRR